VPASALPMLISALKFWPVRENFKDAKVFKEKLHARCHMFRKICKDFMDKLERRLQMRKDEMDSAFELLGSCLLILIFMAFILFL
jgi:hypothetical protein